MEATNESARPGRVGKIARLATPTRGPDPQEKAI
ncbi:hypothetical protein AWB81_08517 [Caballeronia arationis]|jgi:hypothetical protein|nr:hypothetical protein AWB81_08517 [Caballeronia arationis]